MKPNTQTRERKTFEFKAELSANTGKGNASVMGMIDLGGDCIFPGAFGKAQCKDFVDNGFIALGHDWEGPPIGFPTSCKEVGANLECEWEYHSTELAQDARVIATERIEAGKFVGLSIGYRPDYAKGVVYFESGQKMLDFAEANGYDLKLFDTAQIKKAGYCRAITKMARLFEFSQVNVPMNPAAGVLAVKDFDGDGEGSLAGLRLLDHLDSALAAVDGAITRFSGYAATKSADSRPVPEDRITQIEALHKRIGDLLGSLEVADTPLESESKFRELQFRTLSLQTIARS